MAQKKTYNVGDIVGKVGDPSVHGVVESVENGKDGKQYFVKFYNVETPGEYEADVYDETELLNKNSPSSKKRLSKLNVGPGGSKSRRRSRKNRRTRRFRR